MTKFVFYNKIMSDNISKNFTVYRSSAGSGKTYTLVKEYLKIILQDPEKFRQILAITFTNKAAREMKERVLSNLHAISQYNDEKSDANTNGLIEKLISETGLIKPEIIINAGKALTLILHNYADFSISTIDSFVHRVIRSFARELDLSINFEVEMDSDELISKCIDLLLDEAGNNVELTDILLKFIKYKSAEERSLKIEFDLNTFARNLNKEVIQNYLVEFRKLKPADFSLVFIRTNDFIRQFERNLYDIASVACKIITDNGIQESSFYQGTRGIGRFFSDIAGGRIERVCPNTYVEKTINEDKWISGKATHEEEEKIHSVKEELINLYNKIKVKKESDYTRYVSYTLLNKNIYQLAVLNLIEKVIDKFKKENNLLMISEFNRKISEIVFSEPVPFIYERLGERYKHFFIDEFQDTSVLQWMNLLPLIDNSLAEGNFNMIVGDGKQAIYRWRNGEVEQFIKLPLLTGKIKTPFDSEREETLKRNYFADDLKMNYRSRNNIVDFNNQFFSYITENILPDNWKDVYGNPCQIKNDKKPGGFVSIDFPFNEEGSELSYSEITNNRVLEIIHKQFELGYQAKDIAVLCRTKGKIRELANFLSRQKIDVVSSEALLLASSPAVSFLIACMKLISDHDDTISMEEISRFLKRDVGESMPLDAELDITNKNRLTYMSKFGVYDLCEYLVSSSYLNKDVDIYIHYFLDIVHEYTTKHNPDIIGFLAWWEDKKGESYAVIPEETNAVRMMTIHKAKGLQFPVVIYPYAIQEAKTSEKILFIPNEDEYISKLPFLIFNINKQIDKTAYADYYKQEKEKSLLDMINLLYVVMTRAEDNLYIISEKPSKNSNSDTLKVHYILNDYLKSRFELGEDEVGFVFGTETVKTSATPGLYPEGLKLRKVISTRWQNHAIISRRAPEIWNMDDPDSNRRLGNLVHTLLSKIKYSEDKDAVMDKFYSEGYFDAAGKQKLSGKLDEVFGNPLLKPFFSKGAEVMNEAEIIVPEGKTYRPDRVVTDGKKAVVIDYKTGISSRHHQKQIDNYASLLMEMGYFVEKKFLVYIDDFVDVMEV